MNMRQLPTEERPREKLLRAGKESLSTTEILAILLRSGTKDRSALELASRPSARRIRIGSARDIAEIFMERMRYYKKEHFISLMLNAKGEIIEESNISVGDLCSSTTHPREVFVDAVRRSAGSVVFLHNHPSGDPEPSEADVETTVRLMEAGAILGIPVLDHIVIGDGNYVSMKARGMI